MTTAAIFLPLLFASLFMIAAVREELAHLRHSRLLAPAFARTRIWPHARASLHDDLVASQIDPAVIAALNAADFDRVMGRCPWRLAKGALKDCR